MKQPIDLTEVRKRSRQTLLGLHKRANSGHIGCSLSCLDLLIFLFFQQLEEHDEFILSKGHAAAALYTVLAEAGLIAREELDTYYRDDTYLAAHPPTSGKVSRISFATGSLGHGLSLGTGIALATRFTKKPKQVYCLLSDGDCNEGSTWEALFFAAHHGLSNLTIIIDNNNLQGFGRTEEVMDMAHLEKTLRSVGYNVIKTDGHDFKALTQSFAEAAQSDNGKPQLILARTVKGKGVSYMEDKMEWHYLPMTDELFEQAISESQDLIIEGIGSGPKVKK